MFVVFLHHYNPRPSLPIVSAIVSQGYCGVQFFFVLSGFLITGILWDSRHQANRLRDFYGRRILRIFPLYYGTWLLLILLTPVAHWNWNWRWLMYLGHLGNYVRFVFFNPKNVVWLDTLSSASVHVPFIFLGHLWSLCVEEQFYLVWPWLVFLCASRERLRALCIGVMAFAILLRPLLVSFAPPHMIAVELIYRSMPTQMDALALGGLLATLIRGPEADFLRRHNGAICALMASTAVLYWIFVVATFGKAMPGTNLTVFEYYGLPAMNMLGAAMVLRTIHPGSEMERVFSWRPLAYFGGITYGFYVFHDPPHFIYYKLAAHISQGANLFSVTACIAFVSTLVLASLSFYYFEKPILRLKRLFNHQVHRAPMA